MNEVIKSKRSTVRTVLFDLDGTLLDSWPDIYYSLICIIEKFFPDMTTEHLNSIKYLNLTSPESIIRKAIKLESDEVLPEEILLFGKTMYSQIMGRHENPYNGIENLIHLLDRNNIRWGIVTNRSKHFAGLSISKFNIFKTIKCLVCSDDVLRPKPESDSLLLAAKILEVSAEDCIFVGDMDTDIIAGMAAGMKTIAIKHGYGFYNYNSTQDSADFIVNDLIELNSLFCSLMDIMYDV
ncbi:MAG TPA: hypothetical protein DD381_07105 [Lentisphaeria bacterium]|nr:MAG: hypothetical protein A2X47_05830 [Lentisphaerae bacterium GWF2_38_69]HBM16090.1 hypothetical protein [Lentisphaeria bacterium]